MNEGIVVRTPPPIANAIRRLLRRHGTSERSMSKALGKGKTWLSDGLKGRYPLTFEAVDQIARELGLPTRGLLVEAYPDPDDSTVSPHALLADLAPKREERPLPANVREELEAFLGHKPKVKLTEPPDYNVLRGIQSSFWLDRSRVVEYALFHVTAMLKPRSIHAFIGALATLSDVLGACRSVDLFHRSRLLLRAHDLLDAHPHPQISALVTEKTAYLCWYLTSNPQIASKLLDHPSTIPHPFPDHLFACRARFCMLRGQAAEALAYIDIVLSLRASPITMASAHSIAANVYARQNDVDMGSAHIARALDLQKLPPDLRINLETEQARLQVLSGHPERAIGTFLRIIEDRPYCDLWPLKAAYVARDLLEADPTRAVVQKALPRILEIQANLDPNLKIEVGVLHSLAEHLAAHTGTSSKALQKQDIDPNG